MEGSIHGALKGRGLRCILLYLIIIMSHMDGSQRNQLDMEVAQDAQHCI